MISHDFTLFNEGLRDVQRASFLRRWTSYRYVPMWPEAVAKLCWQSGSPTKPWSFGRWWNSEVAAASIRQRQLCCLPNGFLLRKTWESIGKLCLHSTGLRLVSVCLSPFRKLSKVASVSISGSQMFPVCCYVTRCTSLHIIAHHCTMSPCHHVARVFSIVLPSQVKELPPSSELGSAERSVDSR